MDKRPGRPVKDFFRKADPRAYLLVLRLGIGVALKQLLNPPVLRPGTCPRNRGKRLSAKDRRGNGRPRRAGHPKFLGCTAPIGVRAVPFRIRNHQLSHDRFEGTVEVTAVNDGGNRLAGGNTPGNSRPHCMNGASHPCLSS